MLRRILLVGVAALVVAGAVVAVNIKLDADKSPEQVLASTASFVESRERVRFDGKLTLELGGAAGERGSRQVSRVTLDGVTEFGKRSVVNVDAGEILTEVITIGRKTYVREAESKRELRREKYAAFDPDEAAARQGIIDQPSQAAALGEPTDLPKTLATAKNPRIDSRDGSTTVLTMDFDPAGDNQEIDDAVDTARLTLTVLGSGEIRAATYKITGEELGIDATYTFSAWGAPVAIDAPAQGEIDPTPFVDEEALADFDDAALFQPVGIPEGWVFDGAGIAPAEDTAEGCDQASIDYADPDDPEAGYLYLFEFPVECAEPFEGVGVKPFRAGSYTGGVESDEEGTFAQITVGKTVIQADTDLSPEDLAVVLGALRPFDLDVTPNPLPDIGKRRTAA